MIDFNNPFRPEIEKVLFPNQEAVDNMFNNMNDVLELINSGTLSPELLEINKAYLNNCLLFQAIQQNDIDLSIYADC